MDVDVEVVTPVDNAAQVARTVADRLAPAAVTVGVRGFVERLVGPVRDYDRDRGTTLLETLRTWFEAEGSASGTAERMFVHVNTVYQRLDRLDQVLGEGWRSGDRALELRLAPRLYELVSA